MLEFIIKAALEALPSVFSLISGVVDNWSANHSNAAHVQDVADALGKLSSMVSANAQTIIAKNTSTQA